MTLRDRIANALAVLADRVLALLEAEPESPLQDENERLKEELRAVKGNRLVSAVFATPEGQPHPRVFAVHRVGVGQVAFGAQFPDGSVVIRWTSNNEYPGLTMMYERLPGSVEESLENEVDTVVWLSEELPALAEYEQRVEAAEKKLEKVIIDRARAEAYAENARNCAAILGIGIDPEGFYAGTPGDRLRELLSAESERNAWRDQAHFKLLEVEPCSYVDGFAVSEHQGHVWADANGIRWCPGGQLPQASVSFDEEPPF